MRSITELEGQMVLRGIDAHIKEIDQLILKFGEFPADENNKIVDELKGLRDEFLDHRIKISGATDDSQRWSAARSYSESSPWRSNDLGRIRASQPVVATKVVATTEREPVRRFFFFGILIEIVYRLLKTSKP